MKQAAIERIRDRPNASNIDKWRQLWRILFPNDDAATIPSPCKFLYLDLYVLADLAKIM
jgi:hypothetical protein